MKKLCDPYTSKCLYICYINLLIRVALLVYICCQCYYWVNKKKEIFCFSSCVETSFFFFSAFGWLSLLVWSNAKAIGFQLPVCCRLYRQNIHCSTAFSPVLITCVNGTKIQTASSAFFSFFFPLFLMSILSISFFRYFFEKLNNG